MQFRLQSDYKPSGDQPQAIKTLVDGIKKDHKHQILLGILLLFIMEINLFQFL